MRKVSKKIIAYLIIAALLAGLWYMVWRAYTICVSAAARENRSG